MSARINYEQEKSAQSTIPPGGFRPPKFPLLWNIRGRHESDTDDPDISKRVPYPALPLRIPPLTHLEVEQHDDDGIVVLRISHQFIGDRLEIFRVCRPLHLNSNILNDDIRPG